MSAPGASRVVVIGGGISGLTAAWALRQRGVEVVVLEASARAGGAIATERTGGYVAERGPNSLFESPPVARLVAEVGLASARVAADAAARRRYLVRGGRLVALPASPPALLTTRVLSWRGKLRLALEPFVRRGTAADESVAQLVRRRLGAEVLDQLVDPFIGGTCAGDPERLSARHGLRALADLEARHGSLVVGAWREARARRRAGLPPGRPPMVSFATGLQTLPDAIVAALGGAVRVSTRAVSARQVDGGWVVEAECRGRRERIAAGAVVCAAPAHALGAVALPPALAALLAPVAAVPHAPVATLALGFRRGDVAHALDGFGALVPATERRGLLGVLFSSTVFPDRAPPGEVLLTCFVGGVRRPELAAATPDALTASILPELRALLGVRGAPTFTCHTQWARAIPQFELGHDTVAAAVAAAEGAEPTLAIAGPYLAGAGVGDCVASGYAAADRVGRALEVPRAVPTPDRTVPLAS